MKRILSYALVAILSAGGTALADAVFGGVVLSSSARISEGSFVVLSPTSIRFTVQGTGDYADGGPADDARFRAVECTTSGANLVAAWNAAPATCVPLWRAANRL